MTALDDVVDAIRAADDDGWAIADAIARIPRRGEAGSVTNEGIARYIATKHPVEYSPMHISKMRATADAFPPKHRCLGVAFTAHMILRSNPKKLVDWAAKHPGQSLSAAEAEKLRPKSSAAKSDAEKEAAEWRRLLKRMDELVDLDPGERTLDLEDRARRYRNSYGRKIREAEGRSVLQVV